MGSFKQVSVRCPFYITDDGKKEIICEGLVEDSCIALRYAERGDYQCQIQVFCQGRYTNCEIYRVLIEKEEYD